MNGNQVQQLGLRSVLAVCAHPDDESFGLGAIIGAFTRAGVQVGLLCFTRGEASTLGVGGEDLALRRAGELVAATETLGIHPLRLMSYPDGQLADVDLEVLCGDVASALASGGPDCLLVLDEGGITGHPDHRQATAAAVMAAARSNLPVLAWTLASPVADALTSEFGVGFVGRDESEIAVTLQVDRTVQHAAIRCHASQSSDNPVLRRRLELQGDTESLVWLRAAGQ